MSEILLANSEESTLTILKKMLKTEGYKVTTTTDVSEARHYIESQQFNLAITDTTPDWDPDLSIVSLIKEKQPSMPAIVFFDPSDSNAAAKVSELNPFAILGKPLKVDKLLLTVQQAVDYNDEELAKNVNLNLQLETAYQFKGIVAESPAMKSVCEMVSRVAATDVTILLTGERGTGKIAIAQAIHDTSRRKDGPFVTMEAENGDADSANKLFGAGDTAGELENAAGGTLFIKDIDGLPLGVQAQLAETIHGREVKRVGAAEGVDLNVRFVVSTKKDLQKLVAEGSFDSSLFDLIKIILIKIPPLRDRVVDIGPTVKLILRQVSDESGAMPSVDSEVMTIFEGYSWPGNVREIEKVIRDSLTKVEGNRITRASLPAELAAS